MKRTPSFALRAANLAARTVAGERLHMLHTWDMKTYLAKHIDDEFCISFCLLNQSLFNLLACAKLTL
ncbi:hypothetical protein HZ326_13961 [Fusarium oxysporum f. sp. albedinis]|nr:hypothetical protein HZ326_13961 [Fusarium oxysporum f. sp. albedinis]